MKALQILYNSIRSFYQMIFGSLMLIKTKQPRVTIFGGSRIPPIQALYQQAHELTFLLASQGVTIITGGGPGIMEAASCGTTHVNNGLNIGIGIKSLHKKKNLHLSQYVEIDTFFLRKNLLISFADAFIVFPGGYGTLDELMELLNLIKVKHIEKVPVILINKSFWKGLVDWIKAEMVALNAINSQDPLFMSVVDTNEEVLYVLAQSEKLHFLLHCKA